MRLALRNSAVAETSDVPQDQVVRLDAVHKVYGRGEGAVVALDGVTLGFESGSFTAVMGPSGSGKSTFLHVAAGLDRPTQGTIRLGGVDIAGHSETKLAELRRDRVGFQSRNCSGVAVEYFPIA